MPESVSIAKASRLRKNSTPMSGASEGDIETVEYHLNEELTVSSPNESRPPTQVAQENALHVAHHTPTLHIPRLIKKEQIQTQVHGTSLIGRVNAWLALRITKIVGTMYCAYVFTIIAFVALPSAIQQGSPTVLVNWLSSNFLQLVLLPIIIVGQNVISAAQDARAETDHETLTALHQMNIQQLEILKVQQEILEILKSKAG